MHQIYSIRVVYFVQFTISSLFVSIVDPLSSKSIPKTIYEKKFFDVYNRTEN